MPILMVASIKRAKGASMKYVCTKGGRGGQQIGGVSRRDQDQAEYIKCLGAIKLIHAHTYCGCMHENIDLSLMQAVETV